MKASLLDERNIDVKVAGEKLRVTYSLVERNEEYFGWLTTEVEGKLPNVSEALARLVKSWELFEDDGSMVPLTVERLEQLPVAFKRLVLDHIDEDADPKSIAMAPRSRGGSARGGK